MSLEVDEEFMKGAEDSVAIQVTVNDAYSDENKGTENEE